MTAALIPIFSSAGISAAAGSTIGPVTAAAYSSTVGGTIATALSSSLLSSGLTAASAFGAVKGGFQEQAVYKGMAQQSELAAKAEELRGREQADRIRRSLQATLASQTAAFGARGISTTSGTPVNLAGVSSTEAARDIENAQFGAATSAAAERAQAGQYRLTGKAAVTKGFGNAASYLYAGKNSYGSLLN